MTRTGIILTLAPTAVLLSLRAQANNLAYAAPASVLAADPRTFITNLERGRPPAVTPELKALIRDSLPREGRVKELRPAARRKLASLEQVLRVHQRQAVYDVMVISVPQAFIGLHARAILLISEAALNLFDSEELQALIAHEIGHEYIWDHYEKARQIQDHRRLQELELLCDCVAIITLRQARLDPSRLIAGFEKIARFNSRFGKPLNEDRYPPIVERKEFVRAVVAWSAGANWSDPGIDPEGVPRSTHDVAQPTPPSQDHGSRK